MVVRMTPDEKEDKCCIAHQCWPLRTLCSVSDHPVQAGICSWISDICRKLDTHTISPTHLKTKRQSDVQGNANPPRWLLLDCCVAALLDGPSSNSSSDLSDSSGADMGDMMSIRGVPRRHRGIQNGPEAEGEAG